MKEGFVLFASPRSGSSLLVNKLNSANDIYCYGEAFKRTRIALDPRTLSLLELNAEDIQIRDELGPRFLSSLLQLPPQKIVGFKLFNPHIDAMPWFYDYLREHKLKVLVLSRPFLSVYASILRTEQTGIFRIPAKDKEKDIHVQASHLRVKFKKDSFQNHLNGYNRFISKAMSFLTTEDIKSFIIRYYEIVNSERRMNALLRFLKSDATAEQLKSSMIKQHSLPLEDSFLNWNELVEHLKKNGLYYLLAEANIAYT